MTLSELSALVADDASVTRRQIARMLEDLGVTVAGVAEDGLQAVQQCMTLRPNLLITDLVMPRLGGVDVIRLVKARLESHIIVVTSHCDRAMHARCLALGAGAVLIKPISGDELGQVLTILCREPPARGPTRPAR
jgi:CheY-like chemotaxis protein